MNNLTQEQVRQLTPEAQEALGLQLIERTKRRDQLLRTIKRNGDQTWLELVTSSAWGLLFVWIVCSLTWGGAPYSWPIIAGFLGLAAFLWIVDFTNSMRAIRIDRRLDGLIELLEAEGFFDQPANRPSSARSTSNVANGGSQARDRCQPPWAGQQT